MPTWVKSGLWGLVLGSIVTMIVGFSYGGWITKSTANQLVRQQSDVAVTAALLPVCLARSKDDKTSAKKLGELRAMTSSYEQQEFITKTGWATLPGSDTQSRDLADACASALLKSAATK